MATSDERGELVAKRALVIYEYEKRNTSSFMDEGGEIINAYITLHRVDKNGDLLEGRPLTRDALRKICSLAMPNLMDTVGYLPDNVLSFSPGHALMWWVPSAVRQLFFSNIDGIESGEYPVPPTLFLVLDGKLHTWALHDNSRPVIVSTIYSSPFYNVYETGDCCMGNIKVPDNFSPDTIREWENVFFNGIQTRDISPRFTGIEPAALWNKIRGKKRFPVKYLSPCATLGGIIKSISRGDRTWSLT